MSGSTEDDRAGLYALGALNAEEMRAVRLAAGRDPDLAAEIVVWENRLAPLTALIDPVPPPASLWAQLEARLARITGAPDPVGEIYQVPAQRAKSRRRTSAGPARGYWREAAFGAMALAAGLAAMLFLRTPAPQGQYAMMLPAKPGEGGWLLELKPNGDIRAQAQGALSRALDQDYELWALPLGADRPQPLGLLPVTASATIKPPAVPAHQFQLLVSLEHKGGSVSGLPTGQVLYATPVLSK